MLLLFLYLYLNLPAGEKLYLFKECSISLVGGGHLRFEVRGYLVFRRLILLNFSMLEMVVLATIGYVIDICCFTQLRTYLRRMDQLDDLAVASFK